MQQQAGSTVHAARTVDIQQFIDERPVSWFQRLVVLVCVLVLVLDGFDSGMIAYVAPALAGELGLAAKDVGPLFAAGLAGLTIGAFLCVWIADIIGRKKALALTVLLFGGFTLVSTVVRDFHTLVVLRFLVGLGLGGAGPIAMALIAEICPRGKRSSLLSYLGCGVPLGGIVAGTVATYVIPDFGWHTMFAIGGALPLLLLLVILLWLPESVRFLAGKSSQAAKAEIARVLGKIDPRQALDGVSFTAPHEEKQRAAAVELFRGGLARTTALLWGASFLCMLVVNFVTNWLPILLHGGQYSMRETSMLLSLYLAGSPCGSLLIGRLMDRYNRYACLTAAALVGAVGLFTVGLLVDHPMSAAAVILLVGASSGACVTGVSILASYIYPTAARATGIGWAVGCGRLGSVFGSMSGSFLLAMGLTLPSLLQATAVPCLVAFFCFSTLYVLGQRRRGEVAAPHKAGA